MEPLVLREVPDLRNPLFVMAFAGWNDAAESATRAVRYLVDRLEGERFAWIEPEEFFQFSDQRPMVSLSASGERQIRWPANEFFVCRQPSLERDLVVGVGVEPHLRWKRFAGYVREVIHKTGAQMTVTMGALLGGESHKAPVHLVCLATDQALAERIGVEITRYEGPTGIVGVIHQQAQNEGREAVSLWANVPHYIAGLQNPKATYALLDRLRVLAGLSLDLESLEQTLSGFDRQVDEAIANDPRISRYVSDLREGRVPAELREELEDFDDLDEMEEVDEEDLPGGSEEELPPGDQLADEIERLMRRRRNGPDED